MALPSSYVIMVSTRGLPFESFTDMTPELTPLRFIWARAFWPLTGFPTVSLSLEIKDETPMPFWKALRLRC